MKKYSISFGFSITIGREDRPTEKGDAKESGTSALRKPVLPDPISPYSDEDEDGWITPPEIKAVFDNALPTPIKQHHDIPKRRYLFHEI